jgi:NAD-dependent SIR2 family protein deacetylase
VTDAAVTLGETADEVGALTEFLSEHARVTVLTGAGCSTASGIPDYRDDDGQWKHREPMRFAQFVNHDRNQRRYWAQSFSGWERISAATPNEGHTALAELERLERVHTLVTQNVDMLHQRAGSRSVVDLHGVLHRVRCLSCGKATPRDDFQVQLRDANPEWHAAVRRLAPDGDAKLSRDDFETFVVPRCRCGGTLKPDVVFFGESVPKARVNAAHRAIEESGALLVVGSSLMVYSGYRFALAASKSGKPIAILNRGRTRADHLATLRLRGDCSELLGGVASALG